MLHKKKMKIGMFDFIKKIFKKNFTPTQFPKNGRWMVDTYLNPQFQNLEKCDKFHILMNTPQGREYHKEGNVWKHTKLVANAMQKILFDEQIFSSNDKYVLMLAAICHDLGKAETTVYDEENKTYHSPNHAVASERITRELLYDEDVLIREEVCWLVRNHMLFHNFNYKYLTEHYKLIKEFSCGRSTIEKLLYLSKADIMASKPVQEEELNKYPLYKEIATMCKCYNRPYTNKRFNEYKEPFTMYIMIGLPGSGKDTYIKNYLPNIDCICRDDIREELKYGEVRGHKLLLDHEQENIVTRIVNNRIQACCEKKMSFVINQTSLKRKYRSNFINLAKNFGNPKIVFVYVEAPSVETCIERRGGDKWCDIINNMWNGLEFPVPSEGYDDLYIIK